MKRGTSVSLGLMSVLAICASSVRVASAHHSFAMFDKNHFITKEGTVSRIEWANPHVYLFVAVADEHGATKTYALEGSSPNELSRWGWKKNTLNVGELVSVGFFPLRDGRPGGLIFSVTQADGVVLKAN